MSYSSFDFRLNKRLIFKDERNEAFTHFLDPFLDQYISNKK